MEEVLSFRVRSLGTNLSYEQPVYGPGLMAGIPTRGSYAIGLEEAVAIGASLPTAVTAPLVRG